MPTLTTQLETRAVSPAFDRTWGDQLLDETLTALQAGCVAKAMGDLFDGLAKFRQDASAETWSRFAKERFPAHPVRSLIHQSPFSRRSFEKPRGYAGDALLLDYIYDEATLPATTALGSQICCHERHTSASRSVRARKDILAQGIDETATEFGRPRILSLACGHLREARQAAAVRQGRVATFIAIDQDRESLAVVERDHGARGVQAMHGSVRSLLADKSVLRGFHFVYAAGLYDYLSAPVATRLTAALFQMLAPGGKLLVANFHPRLPAIAYMESVMGWWLIYRTASEVEALAAQVDEREIAAQRTFEDPHRNLVFLEIRRR